MHAHTCEEEAVKLLDGDVSERRRRLELGNLPRRDSPQQPLALSSTK